MSLAQQDPKLYVTLQNLTQIILAQTPIYYKEQQQKQLDRFLDLNNNKQDVLDRLDGLCIQVDSNLSSPTIYVRKKQSWETSVTWSSTHRTIAEAVAEINRIQNATTLAATIEEYLNQNKKALQYDSPN